MAKSPQETKLVPIAPDGGWGWLVVVATFFIHVFVDGFIYSLGVVVDVLQKEFHSSNKVSGLVISLLAGISYGSGPIASAVINKFGCRTATVAGAVISMAGCGASYFASAMWHLVVSVGVVMGVGFGLLYCPAIVAVTTYFEKRRSMATGLAVTGAGVGTFVFPPINDYVITNHGWRAVFILFVISKANVSVLLALCILCGMVYRPLPFLQVTDEEKDDEEIFGDGPDKIANPNHEDPAKQEKVALFPSSNERVSDNSADARSLPDLGSRERKYSSRRRYSVQSAGDRSVGLMNKKDVFYTGSITDVAEFKDDPDSIRSTGSLREESASAQLRTAKEVDASESSENVDGADMYKTASKMVALGLLADPVFLLFCVSNLLTSLGFNSPLYFLPMHARQGVGLSSEEASHIISVYGLSNTLGRVVFGIVADHKLPLPRGWGRDTARNRLWMYNISLAICGLVSGLMFLYKDKISLCIYSAVFGFFLAAYITLTSVVLVDLLGLEKLTNAFGLLLLWQGVGTVFGPPAAGILADMSHSYNPSFIFCGIVLLVSGPMLFVIPALKKRQASQPQS
ncbi:hypothetical protein Q1695_002671 [Nippostrongylus brasiliensis]|nr:hypothetical protein Q1695_002671 [Nippostrongylus brasiliensis]